MSSGRCPRRTPHEVTRTSGSVHPTGGLPAVRIPRTCAVQALLRPMDTLATSNGWTTAAGAEAVTVPRRQAVAIALLVCIPLPLLSVTAAFVPLPQVLARAAASFVSFAVPSTGSDGLIRETRGQEALEIVYEPGEPLPTTEQRTEATVSTRAPKMTARSRSRHPEKETRQESREFHSEPLSTGEDDPGSATPAEPATPTTSEGGPSSEGGPRAENGTPGAAGSGAQSGTGGQQGGGGSGGGSGGAGPGGGRSGAGSAGGGQGGGGSGGSGSGRGSGSGDAGGESASPPEPPKAGAPGSSQGSGGSDGGNGPADPPAGGSARPPVGKGRP